MPLSFGEMYTSLLNVKQAINVERQLIDHLETYIEHESERLEDIKRWVTDRECCHDARLIDYHLYFRLNY